jgi:REP element-mobilizing transposase RayT
VVERRSLRLRGFDYRVCGFYFVTTCARQRDDVFGSVASERVVLNGAGGVVRQQLLSLPTRRRGVELDCWVVMPDHVHVIVVLDGGRPLGEVVAAFKSGASREVGTSLWQRGYFDRVIRDEGELQRAREYIETNPTRWTLSRQSPVAGQ